MVRCTLFPLTGVTLLVQSKVLVRFDERKSGAYPSIARMFILSSFAMALRTLLDFNIIELKMLL